MGIIGAVADHEEIPFVEWEQYERLQRRINLCLIPMLAEPEMHGAVMNMLAAVEDEEQRNEILSLIEERVEDAGRLRAHWVEKPPASRASIANKLSEIWALWAGGAFQGMSIAAHRTDDVMERWSLGKVEPRAFGFEAALFQSQLVHEALHAYANADEEEEDGEDS